MSKPHHPEPKYAKVPRSDDLTGQAALPLSRIKRIIHVDEDVNNCSSNATFAIAIATEMFIQYLADRTHSVMKTDRKQRRVVQYKDIANAVSYFPFDKFLGDVVPKTTTYRQFKQKQERKEKNAKEVAQEREAGQTTLDGKKARKVRKGKQRASDANHAVAQDGEQEKANSAAVGDESTGMIPESQELEVEIRGSRGVRRSNGHRTSDDVDMEYSV
ncbi:MAG: hypothetical protein M1819_001437 [Sarea resinae]|nr:MAG: hypothetical protein M1819_001437 [Sarea resinae]